MQACSLKRTAAKLVAELSAASNPSMGSRSTGSRVRSSACSPSSAKLPCAVPTTSPVSAHVLSTSRGPRPPAPAARRRREPGPTHDVLEALAAEPLIRANVAHLGADAHRRRRQVERGDRSDSRCPTSKILRELLPATSQRGDDPDARDRDLSRCRGHAGHTLVKMTTALLPPNAKELFMAADISSRRALFGTQSMGQSGSGVS